MELKYILGAVVLLYCILVIIKAIIKDRKIEKKKKKLEREQELNETITKSAEKIIELSKKKKENKQKQEQQKQKNYENVEVVYKFLNQFIIIKRNDDRYSAITRNNENITLYENKDILKIDTEKLNTYNWFSKEGYEKIIQVSERKQNLSFYGIDYLYHMTHKDNLESILKNGLKSHNQVRKEMLNNVDISDNQVNNRRSRKEPIYDRSIHDYVPLYFNPKNPMLYVREYIQDDIVILAINPMLLYNENILFTDGNAASNPTKFYNDIKYLEFLSWECINAEYWSSFEDGKRLRCSEVLVYPNIEANQIVKIFCNNEWTKEIVRYKIDNFANGKIEVEINDNLYF